MEIMNAVVYNKKAPEKLVFTSVEKPVAGDSDVLVKIVATAINAADYRSMKMGIIPKKRIFGADVSGRVETVGKNVSTFKPGDEVLGDLAAYGFGGFAEYAVAPEKAWVLKPANLPFEEASAIPMAGLTALQALRDKGKIGEGQKVLIAGGSGGVGTMAIQLARCFGAEVTAVCSTKNVEQSKLLGASEVIDYTKTDFTRTGHHYNLILAVNGNRSLAAYRRILNPAGILVIVGGSLKQIFSALLTGWLFSFGNRKIITLAAKSNQTDLAFLTRLASESKLKPVIDSRFPLEKTAEAMLYVSQGHARGKVIINIERTEILKD
jgi:NADPH:quinone reductase-like Zn-dependent oxidoreductase